MESCFGIRISHDIGYSYILRVRTEMKKKTIPGKSLVEYVIITVTYLLVGSTVKKIPSSVDLIMT